MKTKFTALMVAMLLMLSNFSLAATPAANGLTSAEQYDFNNNMGFVARKNSLGDKLNGVKKVLKLVIDTTTADGQSTFGSIGAHRTAFTLPANAIVTNSYAQINTQFADSGTGTVSVACETAGNILAVRDDTSSSANTYLYGESTGEPSAFKRISSACYVYFIVAGAAQTAGKMTIFIEYVVGE